MLRQADSLQDVNEMLSQDYDGELFTPLELEFIRQVLVDCTRACGAKIDLFWKGHTVVTLPTSRSPLRPHRIELAFLDGITFNILRAVCVRENGKLADTFDKLDVSIMFGVKSPVDSLE